MHLTAPGVEPRRIRFSVPGRLVVDLAGDLEVVVEPTSRPAPRTPGRVA